MTLFELIGDTILTEIKIPHNKKWLKGEYLKEKNINLNNIILNIYLKILYIFENTE